MRYRNSIISLGFVILLIGVLGVPATWKSGLYAAAGLSVIVLGYLAGRDRRSHSAAHAPVTTPAASATTASSAPAAQQATAPTATSIGQ